MDGAEVTGAEVADMLGLADRALVFDLMDLLMAGDVAGALAITDRAHEFGADLGMILGDLLDLVHTLTRLRSVPDLRDGLALPEMERTRGAALADKLPIPVLGRAWQMLLKGIAEVDQAPDRRAAAEMVLIRLCYVADMPPPGELVRRLTSTDRGPNEPGPGAGSSGASGGRVLAVANGAPIAMNAPAAAPRLASYRDVVALVAELREPVLHGYLRNAVHLVRFAPGVIELRPEPDAPRDLAANLSRLLQDATGTRWTIALSKAAGEQTLDQQAAVLHVARRDAAADHPLVRAILDAFPGAVLGAVQDNTADAYGLPPEAFPEMPLGEPVEPADFMTDMPDDWEDDR
jgi:DNA polymerase-3 subunit gamma/tau